MPDLQSIIDDFLIDAIKRAEQRVVRIAHKLCCFWQTTSKAHTCN
jgi:hypothetical protein